MAGGSPPWRGTTSGPSAGAGDVWTEERSDEGRRRLKSLGAARAERAPIFQHWILASAQEARSLTVPSPASDTRSVSVLTPVTSTVSVRAGSRVPTVPVSARVAPSP